MSCCQQLPWIASSVGVARVPSNQDSRHPLTVELPIDGVLLAEGSVVGGHGLGRLRAGRAVEELAKCDDCVDHCSVLLSAMRLVDLLPVKVGSGLLSNLGRQQPPIVSGLPDRVGKVGRSVQGVDVGHPVPVEVVAGELFPQVAT